MNTAAHRLSPLLIERYRQTGWLVPPYRLPIDLLHDLQQALDELIRNNPGVRPEKLVSAHIQGDNGEGVKGSRRFLDLAMHPAIVDMVEDLIGPNIILWGCHVFCKPPEEGYETPWHQDGHYWPIRPLATCTVWVALEPSNRANGCLRVIPGSHRDKVLHPHLHEDRDDLTLQQRMQDGSFSEQEAVEIELEPGQSFAIAGLLDNRTTEALSKIAGLGDIPFFGRLFRSRSMNKSRSELLVLVTPRLLAWHRKN